MLYSREFLFLHLKRVSLFPEYIISQFAHYLWNLSFKHNHEFQSVLCKSEACSHHFYNTTKSALSLAFHSEFFSLKLDVGHGFYSLSKVIDHLRPRVNFKHS